MAIARAEGISSRSSAPRPRLTSGESGGEVVDVGPNAEKCFAKLGAGLTGLPANRKQSFLCDDWSHGDRHLAGALGAVLLQGLISKGFVASVPGSRELTVTEAGEKVLAEFYTS